MTITKSVKLKKYYSLAQSAVLGLYRELYDEPNVQVYSSYGKLNAKGLEQFVLRVIGKIGRVFHYSVFSSWPGVIRINSDAVYIIDAGFLRRIDKHFLSKLEKGGAKLILILLDSMHASSPDLMYAKEIMGSIKWSAVYTIDKEDANEFGWNWMGFNYYSKPKIKATDIDYDCYFIGGLKGNRQKTIYELFNYIKSKGGKPKFDLFCYSEEQVKEYNELLGLKLLKTWLPYEEILKRTSSANCIIEILQDGQNCQSLRYFEAVVLNKKLLTNNKHIAELPFYDRRYMHYFEKVDDIDINWVKKQEKFDYQYNNEFSIRKFFEKIKDTI